ncbi:hypothetical protein ACFPDQ_05145 [Pseudofrancisella aestuarii]|uniref:Squalene/phytoene synthase family protein n=1 Tax=Pseudofrancisella aestuarii TaxID=2670347 RepID=A0ABV9TC96_9GAMM|nr:hypothetical protein [Pseudofrancisella aestuarii]
MKYNYFDYKNDKLPTYGSVVYFAYRKLNNDKKQILYALDQIKSQIISCTELYDNIEVAKEKMNWWIKEINSIKNNETVSSPQLKLLLNHFDKDLLYKNIINDITHSIENSSQSERDFNNHIKVNFLGIETLKALYLNNFDKIDQATIEQINKNNEIIRHIFCMPKHYYNQIIFDEKILPNMSQSEFSNICKTWRKEYKEVKTNKTLRPLNTINKIHNKMAIKYSKKVKSPFRETLVFSPLTLLFYSI